MSQEYVGCYVADLTVAWFAGAASTVQSATECYNRAATAKARFYGLTKFNQCYIGDGTTYSSKGMNISLVKTRLIVKDCSLRSSACMEPIRRLARSRISETMMGLPCMRLVTREAYL